MGLGDEGCNPRVFGVVLQGGMWEVWIGRLCVCDYGCYIGTA